MANSFQPLSLDPSDTLYDADFYAWTQEQAHLLANGRWHQLDISNLVEEIQALGRQQRQELRNRLGVLLGHLLKWQFQPQRRSKSWFVTLRQQRREIWTLLDESPSLKPYLPAAITKGYDAGLDLAVKETSQTYKDFPAVCPYSIEDVLAGEFFPGEASELAQSLLAELEAESNS